MRSLPSIPLLIPVSFALGLLLGYYWFRGAPADPVLVARVDTVLAEGPTARAVRDSLRLALDRLRADTVRRVALQHVADQQRDSITALTTALVTASTPADTIANLTLTVAVLTRRAVNLDSLYRGERQRVTDLLSVADSAHTASEQRISRLEQALAAARSGLQDARAPGRWSLGVTGGYGAVLSGGTVHAGPSVTAGITYRAF